MLLEHFSLLAQIEFRTFRWCLTFLPAALSPSLAVAYRQLYLLAAFCLLSSPQLSPHTLEYRSLLSAWVAWICGDNASRSPEMMKLNLGLPFPSALSSSLTKATKLLFLPFPRLEQWITEWLFKKYYKRLKDFPAAQCNHKDAPNRFRSHSSLFIDSDVVAKRCYGMRYKMKSFQIRAKGWGEMNLVASPYKRSRNAVFVWTKKVRRLLWWRCGRVKFNHECQRIPIVVTFFSLSCVPNT